MHIKILNCSLTLHIWMETSVIWGHQALNYSAGLFFPCWFICLFVISPDNFFFFWPLSLWDFSSQTRDWTWTPGSESTESKPLDHQGIPSHDNLRIFENEKLSLQSLPVGVKLDVGFNVLVISIVAHWTKWLLST